MPAYHNLHAVRVETRHVAAANGAKRKGNRMCYDNGLNKVCEKQVGDLAPGEVFRTPDGKSFMVLSLPADFDGYTRCVDLANGAVATIPNSVRLGRDRGYRLYASRYLNPAPAAPLDSAGFN